MAGLLTRVTQRRNVSWATRSDLPSGVKILVADSLMRRIRCVLDTGCYMDDSSEKSTRELVTLPSDLAKRVEAFRARVGNMSKSESLKLLIEGGLRRYDTRDDLFERCQEATRRGQSLGDVIMQILADHPLVERTMLDSASLCAYLTRDNPDEADFRFRFIRGAHRWVWEYEDAYNNNEWKAVSRGKPSPAPRSKAELDDDIPF